MTQAHLVQIAHGGERRVALVREPHLVILREASTVLELARRALAEERPITTVADGLQSGDAISYDEVYEGRSPWKLVAPIDCPTDPQRIAVSGTGLTHLGSARNRQAMHAAPTAAEEAQMTDSMRMFEWGRQGGRPPEGQAGVAPEWFHKGDGSLVRGPFAALEIPGHAEDGGEEAEIAAIYLIGDDGTPWRIGMTTGNEFSDHVFERRNYLNLAASKLRTCGIGPELVVGGGFGDVRGRARIYRGGEVLWDREIRTGEQNMCHSLANLEHHHFKFANHRQAGMVHIHFMGADCLSYGEGVRLEAGDITEIEFENFGRALRNVIAKEERLGTPVRVRPMH
jgi:hypothetical protein